MENQEFWDKLEAAVLNPDKAVALHETVALLHLAHRENLEMPCAAVESSDGPKLVHHVLLTVEGRTHIVIFTGLNVFRRSWISREKHCNLVRISGKGLMDDLFTRDELGGLIFNPVSTIIGLHYDLIVDKRMIFPVLS